MCFSITNNVHAIVYDKKRSQIKKEIKVHNKASRNMVSGILRFLSGTFTPTSCNSQPLTPDYAKPYIPCYFNVGDGGIELVDGKQSIPDGSRIPNLVPGWDEFVDYSHKNLERELFVNPDGTASNERTRIGKVTLTLDEPNTADMDSIYFYCEMQPGLINQAYGNKPVCISELGLFASNLPGTPDLLASIKLSNYEDPDTHESKTNILYVRPDDTLIVRWVITIAAIGKDSILKANVTDEYGDIITSTIVQVPNVGNMEIVDADVPPNQGN